MKRIIAKIYRIAFQITGARLFSFIFALAYITALNMVTIYGLCLLLEDLVPTQMLLKIFSFPLIVPTSLVMLGINYMLAPSLYSISASEKRRNANYATVVIYSAVSLILFAYSQLFDKIF
jgi:hypothetical protein